MRQHRNRDRTAPLRVRHGDSDRRTDSNDSNGDDDRDDRSYR